MAKSCFHCSLPVPRKLDYWLEIEGNKEYFCCGGCLAVASTINGCGLDNFYRLRDKSQNQVDRKTEQNPFFYLDQPDFKHESLVRTDDCAKLSVSLVGLTCVACVWLIEKYLLQQLNVDKVDISHVSQRAVIYFDETKVKASQIMQAISSLGYQATLDRNTSRLKLIEQERKRALAGLGVAAIGMMQVGMYAIALHAGAMQGINELERNLLRHAALIICTLVVFYSARPFFKSAWIALKHKSLVMDVPVSIAILAAYSASLWSTFRGQGEVYFDSVAMFTFFLLLSRFLESQARSKLDIQPVQSLIPDVAIISDRQGNKMAEVATNQLKVGDLILIQPGKAIPADLRIVSGSGDVDESILSGEFNPVIREEGDELVAGSMNGEGVLVGMVIRLNQNSSLAIIDRLYEDALSLRSAFEQLADRLSGWFIAVVLGAAVITYLVWLFVEPANAFWIMLSVLVVSCPCALSLATPTSVTAAIFALRKRGILVRHSGVLDQLRTATDVIFDKTGTLTEGRARIDRIRIASSLSEQECMNLAASLEAQSSHPFAKAFTETGFDRVQLQTIQVVPGSGVQGCWNNQLVKIGNQGFVEDCPEISQQINEIDIVDEEQIAIYLSSDKQLLAAFYVQDNIRNSAQEALSGLLTQGLQLHLLSGDPSHQAEKVAQKVGIAHWRKHFSAEQKLDYINALQSQGRKVIFVGDGINDVPAMGAADISVVVAQAPDLVQARADIGLVTSDLRLLNQLLEQSHRLSKVLRQNIYWAVLYNLSAIPAAALGLIAPWLAAIGMSLSSLVVVFNALRLRALKGSGDL